MTEETPEQFLQKRSIIYPNTATNVVDTRIALEAVEMARKQEKELYKEAEKRLSKRLISLEQAEQRGFEKAKKETAKADYDFLESLKLDDLYLQATRERSHFYVASIVKKLLNKKEEIKKRWLR